jgi:tetratricopeptide (TPR) repeat protein
MPPFNRETALKAAEKALRQGRIDAAITEYVRIVEAQPRDWNSANALGDLYVRANVIDKGIAQYTRIADHLAAEGFYPKAGALYKKILKIKPNDEYALLQSAEIAAKQGLLVDAKNAFRQVADRRRKSGNKKGAAEIAIRVGALDPDDLELRAAAARASAELGDVDTAVGEFRGVAASYEKLGDIPAALAAFKEAYALNSADAEIRARLLNGYLRTGDLKQARAHAESPAELKQVAAAYEAAGQPDAMLEVLADIASRDPGDLDVRALLAQAYLGKGDLARARTYLNAETAGTNPKLWLALAEAELISGRLDEGRFAVANTLKLDPAESPAAIALAGRLAEQLPEAGYVCVDAIAEAAVSAGNYANAAAALQEFVARVRHHVVALMRLVEVCVDGGLESTMHDAQAQLADAYLEAGRGLEARIISEDLVAREPWLTANIDRFRRSLIMLGEPDPDSIIAERLSGDSPFLATAKMDLNEGVFFEDSPPTPASAPKSAAASTPAPQAPAAARSAVSESKPAASLGAASSAKEAKPGPQKAAETGDDETAAEQYRLALTYRDLGMFEDAIHSLEVAAESPRQRFEAASLIGQLYQEQGKTSEAIEWLERAAAAAAPTPDAAREVARKIKSLSKLQVKE